MADADGATGKAAGSGGKKKLVLFAVVGLVALLGAGAGGAWALGLFGGGDEAVAEADAEGASAKAASTAVDTYDEAAADGDAPAGEPIFVDLPQMLVNLVSDTGGTRFLKLTLAVEVADARTAARIEQLSPRIVDSFQLYLRTLTPNELRGPGSMFRLKEDLHVRIHQAIEPAKVRDVLFKEMLVQ